MIAIAVLLPSNTFAQSRERVVGVAQSTTRERRVMSGNADSRRGKSLLDRSVVAVLSAYPGKSYAAPKEKAGGGDSKAGKIVLPLVLGMWTLWLVELAKGHP
jgi:hypothetical protein